MSANRTRNVFVVIGAIVFCCAVVFSCVALRTTPVADQIAVIERHGGQASIWEHTIFELPEGAFWCGAHRFWLCTWDRESIHVRISYPNALFADRRVNELRSVKSLWLEGSGVTYVPLNSRDISQLRDVRILNLQGVRVKSLRDLKYLHKLEILQLTGSQVDSLEGIDDLPRLRRILYGETSVDPRQMNKVKSEFPEVHWIFWSMGN